MTPVAGATRIKLCGFTRAEDVRAALALGVEAIGFNLARGPRRIEPDHAAALAALLPPGASGVLLFADADDDAILAAAARTRCAWVQLHGDEPPEQAERLRRRLRVIKAIRVAGPRDLELARDYPADALLLDACVPGQLGGTGVAWDHGWLTGIDLGRPLLLAGGLTPATVAAAVRATRPWGVDAASGVESAPGRKDAARMAAFVAAVRAA